MRAQSLVQTIPPTLVPNEAVAEFCVVGDANGDGTPDFATGHPLGSWLGVVRVYAGGSGALLGERTAASLGVADQTGLGYELEALGDVTGDGVSEIVAGIASSSNLVGVAIPGRAAILSPPSMSLVLMLTGFAPGDQFGKGLGGFTDVNGDGVPDALIGAPSASPGGVVFAGEARGFDVLTGALFFNLSGSAPGGDAFGRDFAAMGDLDGDGKGDFAVDHFYPSWEAVIVSGDTSQYLYSINGPGFVGWDMASIEDLDFDGSRELVTRSGNGGLDGLTVFSWGTPILTYTVPPLTTLLNFGLSIDSAGDVDGDGLADIVAGAPLSVPPSGGVLGYGAVVVVSGATGNSLHEIYGPYSSGAMGGQVRGAGDVDGDGLDDIAATNLGRVEIWSLVPPGVSIDGIACLGVSGYRPVIGITGTPSLGSVTSVNLSKVLSGRAAILLYGPAVNTWAGLPLPFDLGVLGMPGCALAVQPQGVLPLTTVGPATPGSGRATVTLAIPIDPSLVGGSVAFQWYVQDPGPAPLPGVTTRRLIATIQ